MWRNLYFSRFRTVRVAVSKLLVAEFAGGCMRFAMLCLYVALRCKHDMLWRLDRGEYCISSRYAGGNVEARVHQLQKILHDSSRQTICGMVCQ
jgi:hypothetical protein